MRYNFSPSLWILIYLIFVWFYKRFNCNDYCKKSEIVIIENDTYRYSLHYNYSMRIQRNQSQSVSSDRFKNKINRTYEAYPQLSSSYYGYHVQEIDFNDDHGDNVYDFEWSYIGTIINYIENYEKSESRVLNEEELLGVQRNFSINVNGSEATATMTSLIDPNGKVSFHYDNIPTEIEESQLLSGIVGIIRCEGEICSQYNTSETCQNAKTWKTTCIWCEKGGKCIESNNQDTHGLKVNDCRVEKNSYVNDLNSSTTMKHSETTLGITEVQVSENVMKTTGETDKHLTTKTTEENKQHMSHWYLYVVIPLVASLFLICVGCIIWRWLLRRKRSNE
ncbi:unnamed protein product [Schistosoma rodhaini]|uniref:Egg protein CP391S-like protein n=1 Tax=Schistosoma rodhaini TaxID=6188 RepID=A0AA85EST2_9TREM|nr:unnamed protein product [Schistosoma rodhaini]